MRTVHKIFRKIFVAGVAISMLSLMYAENKNSNAHGGEKLLEQKLFITPNVANGQKMSVSLVDNPATNALLDLIKEKGVITVNAHDYGGFEKVGSLPTSLPTSDAQITTKIGDVILYQGKSLVIFYGSNSWSYTRLGFVDEPFRSRIKTILGSQNVELVLSLE